MEKSLINMEKSYAFYAGGLGLVMVLSLVLNNVPELGLSRFYALPHKREISAVLFMLGALLGTWAVYRHMQRAKFPWAITQSQISWPYLGFVLTSILALVITH